MKVRQFILWILVSMFMLSGCTLQKESVGLSKPSMMTGNAMVIVFGEDVSENSFSSVWVDDRIIGTLSPKGSALTFVCPGKRSVYVEKHSPHCHTSTSKIITAKEGEVLYLEILNNENCKKFELQPVDAGYAEGRLKNLQSKSHIINRHRSCNHN